MRGLKFPGAAPFRGKSAITAFVSLSVAVIAAYGAAGVSYLGFDWGYFLVEQLFGQVPSQQGQTAWMLMAAVMPQLCFASVSPWFTRSESGLRKWLPLMFIVLSYMFIAREASLSDLVESAPLITTLLLVTGTLCAGVSSVCGKFIDWLKSMNRSTFQVATGLSGLLLAGVFGLSKGADWLDPFHGHTLLGLSVFALFLMAAGAAASIGSGSKKEGTGIAFAAGANLPVLVIASLNFIMTVVSYGLDQVGIGLDLGWRAIPSAALILLASALFTAAGGYASIKLRRKLESLTG